MKVRLDTRGLLFWGALVACVALVLALPFVIHTRAFISRLRDSQEKWARLGSRDYEILVASNSLTRCTSGWNAIQIQNGKVLRGENAERGECARAEFAQLTVDALFARVWDECVLHRPLWRPYPLCNVAYDERLGFPRRLDTYTVTGSGEYAPSITVKGLILDP